MNKAKRNDLVSRLFTHGVKESIARELVAGDPDEAERQMEALPFRDSIKTPAAYLIKAIRDRYPMPPDFEQKKEKAKKVRQAETRRNESIALADKWEEYKPQYYAYIAIERQLTRESRKEIFAAFLKEFEELDLVIERLSTQEQNELELVEFARFATERPELRVMTFEAWLEQHITSTDGISATGVDSAESSIEKKEQIEKWEPPAPFYDFQLPDFPVEALPTWLQLFVTEEASSTQTPASLAGMMALSTCSAAVARKVRIQARKGWQEPLNIFTVTALPPANRKSQVVTDSIYPLVAYERKLIRETKERIAAERSEFRILQGELAELEKRTARAEPEQASQLKEQALAKACELELRMLPYFPKLWVDDVTPEVLASTLAEQGGRIALFSAEGGIFETLAGRYTNGTMNIDVVLKGHSGDDVRVDRKDRSESIEQPALTMGLAVQPDVLRGLMEKPGFRGRGLIGRFLYSLPQSTLGKRKIRPGSISSDVRTSYHRHIALLAAIEALKDEEGAAEPRLITLSKKADDRLAALEEEIELKLGEDGELASMGDWGGKLAGATVRIAGILHLAYHSEHLLEKEWPGEVSAETLEHAITIARYLIPHARMAYAEMGSDQKVEDAKLLLRWIEKNREEEFTKRQAYQAMKGRFKQVAMLEPVLKVLEDHGYIRSIDEPSTARNAGRKPSEQFLVNPLYREVK